MRKILVIVIALIVIVAIVYVGVKGVRRVMRHQQSDQAQEEGMTATPTAMTTQAASPSANSVYMMKTGAAGSYMTDPKGMTLYTFDKDTKGVSNCSGTCLTTWPAYGAATANAQGALPANISVIKRTDGSMQYALNSMPLYYYSLDKAAGDTNGDGVGGVWHVAK